MGRCVTALCRVGLWLTAAGWFWCGLAQPRPLLNEVMSADNTSFADEDGAFEDWIELVNAGDSEAQLEGWGLSDDAAQPLKWTFPATLLPPGGHLLVWASGKDRRPPQAADLSALPLVPSNSVWRYRDSGLAPDTGWHLPAYVDSAWSSGEAMLGYGASEIKTLLSFGADPANKFPATYFRLTFHSPVAAQDTQGPGLLKLWADDGAIIYLNGVEVLRVRMPGGPVTHLTHASQLANGRGAWEPFNIPLDALRQGVNVLAAEVHQVNATSSDLCFWLALDARRARLHTNFTLPPGFYADPVSVGLSHDDPASAIYYTLDGSTPTPAATASCFRYEGPLVFADRSASPNRLSLIPANPPEMTNHTQYGWMAPASQVPKVTVVRAMAFRDGWYAPRGAAGTWLIGGDAIRHTLRVVSLMSEEACEIYCCNTDWPGNNLGLWRLRTAFAPNAPYGHDGRWRWLLYDTDHGFGQSSNVNTDMMNQARRSSRGVCQPHFDRLLANADFRARFVNRFADLLNTAFVPARVHRIIDETAALVESEMPRHIARWGRMGSFAAWQTRINGLKTFASGRPAPALTNLVNEFGLGGTARLTVARSNGMGRVTVNTVTIDAATPGLANPAAPYPWHGIYFRTVPVTLTAQADPGFTFSHWETADGNRTDPTLAIILTGDVIALLVPDRSRELDRVVFGTQSANISHGRWPNGAAGIWNGFTRPTPGLPNRNPAFSAGLLPGLPAQTAQAGAPLALLCATTGAVSGAVYAVVEGPEGASIDAAGLFTWTPPSDLGSGVYAFRLTLMGLLGNLPVTDETTLLVSVRTFSHARIDAAAEPAGGGTVSGGGLYAVGTQITLSPEAAPLWRFARWSDGLTAPTRQITVQRDVTYTALFAYGLGIPERVSGTVSDGLPLLYWSPVADAEGYVVRRAASRAGPFTVIGMPTANVFLDTAPLVGIDAVYTVSARHGGSEGETSQATPVYAGGVTRKLTGSVIGTLGAYGNNPSRTRDMAFDGNLATFYDAAADGGWPGLDVGSERWWRLVRLLYAPRVEFPGRMVNGAFEVTCLSDGVTTFEAPLVLHTVAAAPPINQYTEASLNQDLNMRYLRYRPPPGGWGNIAELEVYGHETVPLAPANLSAEAAGTNTVSLTWSDTARCQGYLIMRAQAAGSPFAPVAFSEATSLLDTGLAAGTGYRYCVAAVNGSSLSAASSQTAATTALLPPVVPRFAAPQSGAAVTVGGGETTIYLSGALDPRLELVCSADLSTPVATWQPVAGAAFAPPDPETGAVRVTVTTTAPQLFFAVRLRP